MKHITELKRPSARTYARRALSLLKQGSAHLRAMDDCFEMGNGAAVCKEILTQYDNDPAIKALIDSDYGKRHIDIEHWRKRDETQA